MLKSRFLRNDGVYISHSGHAHFHGQTVEVNNASRSPGGDAITK